MGKLSQLTTIKPSIVMLVLLSFILSGCAANNRNMSDVANQLRQNLPVETAITKLEAIRVERKSSAQHQLNLGYLQLVSGDYNNALINFEQAKQTMASLQAISISENVSSVTINETFRSYSGWPTDQVLVHGMMAMAYLLSDDLNGARVEILQADTQMNKLAESDSTQGQLAFVRYLAGVIYELNEEHDNALISYRMALSILQARQELPPLPLQQSLIDLTARVGLNEESKKYQQQFHLPLSKQYTNKQFIFAFDGVVTQMKEAKSMLWWDIDDVYLSVALPSFPRNNYHVSKFYLQGKNNEIDTQSIELIEKRAREDLQERMPIITATALARAGAKFQTVKELNKKDNVLGAFANVLTIISEVADLRHWSMLPSSIQIATSYESAGTLKISSRYGQQILGESTDDEQQNKPLNSPHVEDNLANSGAPDNQLSDENTDEELIARKQMTKSKGAEKIDLQQVNVQISYTPEQTSKESIAYLSDTTKKNTVILLSSVTNKIHIASF